ncbi:WEB family protein At2g40480-like [Lotus japonicus]|uniref:WEB family protein At2g40480-like n=1 Tax=Lotus japonicus TaxID=34305 RepID=UPI00258F08C4|nr:WEB family protein At2g40480-like [Lotus japonicus]
MAESLEPDGFPVAVGMREVRPETEDGSGGNPGPGIRRVGLRAEIDTTAPFGSVKEAVTRFGGSGPWIPLYKLGEAYNSIEDLDIKKVEEQAAKLEKDLIVKELETLDVLEELGATKTIVEELKQKLQTEAAKHFATPELNPHDQVRAPVKNHVNTVNNKEQISQSPSLFSTSSPDLLLMEFKQAKQNLGKTINDLGVIQSSVETLNKKLKKERLFLERTRENLASKFAAISAQDVAKNEARLKPPPEAPVDTGFTFHIHQSVVRDLEVDAGQYNGMDETRSVKVSKPLSEYGDNGFSIKTAEMRWLAAKKMEEAAMAAEAVALAEIKALSSAELSSGFAFPEHQKVSCELGVRSPLNLKVQVPEESTWKKVVDSKFQIDETSSSKLSILKKMEEAAEEVLHSKKVLREALNSIETANRKQRAAEEALRSWIPEDGLKRWAVYNSIKRDKLYQLGNCQDLKPIAKSSVSMRDVLSRKQVPEEYTATKEMEERGESNVALSQMLLALREDPTPTAKHDNDRSDQQQFTRKKFGFIQISLPLGKRRNKRA